VGSLDWTLPGLDWALVVGLPLLGLLMISRFPYPHVLNRYSTEPRSPLAIVFLVLGVFLAIEVPEGLLAGVFLAYALSGPLVWLARVATGRPRWAVEEDEDEDEDPSVVVAEAETVRDEPR
jgi:phosphatidylserine synthase